MSAATTEAGSRACCVSCSSVAAGNRAPHDGLCIPQRLLAALVAALASALHPTVQATFAQVTSQITASQGQADPSSSLGPGPSSSANVAPAAPQVVDLGVVGRGRRRVTPVAVGGAASAAAVPAGGYLKAATCCELCLQRPAGLLLLHLTPGLYMLPRSIQAHLPDPC